MLKKQNRLKNTSAFNATYKNHHVISDDFICVYLGKEKADCEQRVKDGWMTPERNSFSASNQAADCEQRVKDGWTTPERNSFNASNQDSEKKFNTRIAFVVSKKIHKRAVVRNRIKRLMRENIRLALKNNSLQNLNKYISIILVAKQKSAFACFNDIKSSIYNLFEHKI